MSPGIEPLDVGHESSTTQTETKDGSTTTTTTKWTIGTADLALVFVTILCLILFLMSLFIESMRDSVAGALPVLLGVFTLAVGGTAAYKISKKP